MTATAISYDGNSLQTASITTDKVSHVNSPEKNAKLYPLAHANRNARPYVGYNGKTIKQTGTLKASSVAALDALCDTFKSYFNGQDKNLDIGFAGGTRRYIATAQTPIINNDMGLTFATFDVTYDCTLPFGLDTSATTALSASGRTLGNYNDNYTFLGTAPYQAPIVTLTMTTIADADSRQLIWGNGGNGQVIVINRIFTSGDVVVINCEQGTVTVNGTPVSFTGAFPAFAIGAQVMQYTDNFTSRTFSISVAYTKRYM